MPEIDWYELEYFSREEFKYPDEMSPQLLRWLDSARRLAGVPFKITSDFRTPEENEAAGGEPTSAHLKGLAVDIACPDSHYRGLILHALYAIGFKRIGIGSNFLHADIDDSLPTPRAWVC